MCMPWFIVPQTSQPYGPSWHTLSQRMSHWIFSGFTRMQCAFQLFAPSRFLPVWEAWCQRSQVEPCCTMEVSWADCLVAGHAQHPDIATATISDLEHGKPSQPAAVSCAQDLLNSGSKLRRGYLQREQTPSTSSPLPQTQCLPDVESTTSGHVWQRVQLRGRSEKWMFGFLSCAGGWVTAHHVKRSSTLTCSLSNALCQAKVVPSCSACCPLPSLRVISFLSPHPCFPLPLSPLADLHFLPRASWKELQPVPVRFCKASKNINCAACNSPTTFRVVGPCCTAC